MTFGTEIVYSTLCLASDCGPTHHQKTHHNEGAPYAPNVVMAPTVQRPKLLSGHTQGLRGD